MEVVSPHIVVFTKSEEGAAIAGQKRLAKGGADACWRARNVFSVPSPRTLGERGRGEG
ncbi:MAG: hypothetical protein JWO56_2290 [Acidobacteria bacterium]|nr:hypothetical protein [Acidobacteriota bacterium]